jgi:predicted GNAT family N-acyltransferase
MELTVGSKSFATAFFVVEVQCNYSVILGRDWIHANHCIPSTLHQFLIQWIDDEIEVVHVQVSA